MSKETGGNAFPTQGWDYDGQNNVLQYQEEGMSMRDYFAAKAMESLIPIYWRDHLEDYDSAGDMLKCLSESAYDHADAMLKVRNK